MVPPEAAAIVPWQLTGSLIEPVPEKPWPLATVSVVPAVWTNPAPEQEAKLAGDPAGNSSNSSATETDMEPTFWRVPCERSMMELVARSELGLLPPSKTP